jgi:hypothetical protein
VRDRDRREGKEKEEEREKDMRIVQATASNTKKNARLCKSLGEKEIEKRSENILLLLLLLFSSPR